MYSITPAHLSQQLEEHARRMVLIAVNQRTESVTAIMLIPVVASRVHSSSGALLASV